MLREQAQNESIRPSETPVKREVTSSNSGYGRRPDDTKNTPDRSGYSRREERANEVKQESPQEQKPIETRSMDDRPTHDRRDYRGTRGGDHYSSGRREYPDRNDHHDRRHTAERRDYGERRDYSGRDRRDYNRRDDGPSRYRDDRYERRDERPTRYRERDTRGGDRYYDNTNNQQQRYSRSTDYSNNGDDALYNEDLTNVVPIDKLERKSLWDLKPKGFEKVSSERAKISGLFPLPGESKQVDISKLEGLVSGGDLNSQTSILFEEISIESLSSRNSKQLIITGVEFSLFPVERLVEYLKTYINSLKVENAFIVSHELIESKYLVINLSNSNITTILYSSFKYFQNELHLKIKIDRPQSYITPNSKLLSPEELSKSKLPDSGNKIAITNIPNDIKQDEILQDLQEIGHVSKIDLLLDNEESSKGIAFVEFEDIIADQAIEAINKIVINETTLFAIFASKGLPKQEEEITYRTISSVAQSGSLKIDTNVLILLNVVHPEELKNEVVYQEVLNDITNECSKYGKVLNVKIPKPAEDYKRNLKSLDTSIGKIFVKFENEEGASRASKLLNGRKYHERTVLVSFLPESDYNLNLF